MAQKVDLYSILMSYANKNKTPFIDIEHFLEFIEQYAKKMSAEQPEWQKWTEDRNLKFWAEMNPLIEEGKCDLIADSAQGRVYLTHFYLGLLDSAYNNADEEAAYPFPCEDSLRIVLPLNQVRTLNCDEEFAAYLDKPQSGDIPLLKITFGDNFGDALMTAGMIPRRIAETAMLKIRNYIRSTGNKEYATRKLTVQLQGKEDAIKEHISQIILSPFDSFNYLAEGRELTYIFWSHFTILIKNDIKKKKEFLNSDIAVVQAVYLMETFNKYYRYKAVRKQEMEIAFNSLETQLGKPPYLYTIDDILKFQHPKGGLLLNTYKTEGLEAWLKNKITGSDSSKLPAVFVLGGPKGERCYLLKEKYLSLCLRLLAEARVKVKSSVARHWRKMLCDFSREGAMENDSDFEKLLIAFTEKQFPVLIELLNDPKLHFFYDEACSSGAPPSVKLFDKGELLPFSVLLSVKRKAILKEAKLSVPFWYTIPVISAIIAFFKNLKRNKKNNNDSKGKEEFYEDASRRDEIRTAAKKLEAAIIPAGYDLESYLDVLASRWSHLIDKKARENLVEDVQSLVHDSLRRSLKINRNFTLTRLAVNQMAIDIISHNRTLSSLNGQDHLVLYCELYILKLLRSIK